MTSGAQRVVLRGGCSEPAQAGRPPGVATQTTWQQAAAADGKEEVKMLSLVSFKINTN